MKNVCKNESGIVNIKNNMIKDNYEKEKYIKLHIITDFKMCFLRCINEELIVQK